MYFLLMNFTNFITKVIAYITHYQYNVFCANKIINKDLQAKTD